MSKQDPIITCIRKFRTVRNASLQAIVDYYGIPVIVIMLVIMIRDISDPMEITGLLAVAVAAFLFREISHRVPILLEALWVRRLLILPRSRASFADLPERTFLDQLRLRVKGFCTRPSDMPINFEKRYVAYIQNFEKRLNNSVANFVWGIGVGMVVILKYLIEHRWYISFSLYDDYYYIIMYCIAVILGMFLWRMVVIADQIRVLGKNFDFSLQIKHPDGCGGLNILGNLNLINTAIITIPGIYLAVWIIVIRYPTVASSLTSVVVSKEVNATVSAALTNQFILYASGYLQWLDLFQILLAIVVVLTFFIFFIPLYCVHREMELQSGPIRQHLDAILGKISDLTHKLLIATDSNRFSKDNKDIERIKTEIALLQDVYDRNNPVPVWPFNRTTAIQFLAGQSISLLTLSGYFSDTFIDAVGAIFNV